MTTTTTSKVMTVAAVLAAAGLVLDNPTAAERTMLGWDVLVHGDVAARLDAPADGSGCLPATWLFGYACASHDRRGGAFALNNGVCAYRERGRLSLAWYG